MGNASIPDPDEILRALDCIEKSYAFRNSPTMKKFLRFTVEETLLGRADDLNIAIVASRCFEKGPEFSNVTDSSIRVSARRLRRTPAEYRRSLVGFKSVRGPF